MEPAMSRADREDKYSTTATISTIRVNQAPTTNTTIMIPTERNQIVVQSASVDISGIENGNISLSRFDKLHAIYVRVHLFADEFRFQKVRFQGSL